MWSYEELEAVAQRLRDHAEVREVAAVRNSDGLRYILIEPDGFLFWSGAA
ncbi:hypothetical protein [Fodinicola feengrottensis]|nr:hypothetical protein [Fodinicola feengrottensis]